MKLGLGRMERALGELGHPERAWRSVHVAGTNGKGSTCAFAERLFRQSGLRTGLYTSPHLVRFGERLRVDGAEADDDTLASLHDELRKRVPWAFDGPEALTFFEVVTLMAFLHFATQAVDVVVAEVGLGGRLDATNVLSPVACAITPVGFDHAEYLGDTLGLIAGEKAGIIKPKTPCVVARQAPEALAAIRARAFELDAPLELEGEAFGLEPSESHPGTLHFHSKAGTLDRLTLGLEGPHQRGNAALALRLFELATQKPTSEETVREALSATRWPGRFERIDSHPTLVIDGAHNPQGALALAQALDEAFPGRKVRFVVGVLADKSPEPMLDVLAPRAADFIVTAPDSPRAMEAQTLARLARARHPAVRVVENGVRALEEALRSTPSDGVVVACGSLYLVGEWRAHLEGRKKTGPSERLRPE